MRLPGTHICSTISLRKQKFKLSKGMTMQYSKKARTALMQRLHDCGGTLTIEKGEPSQHDVRNLLDHMAILGDVYVQAENTRSVTYSLTPPERES